MALPTDSPPGLDKRRPSLLLMAIGPDSHRIVVCARCSSSGQNRLGCMSIESQFPLPKSSANCRLSSWGNLLTSTLLCSEEHMTGKLNAEISTTSLSPSLIRSFVCDISAPQRCSNVIGLEK